jgi:DNA gyrase subunit A
VRTKVDEISIVGRNTQGVRLISLNEGESLSGLERIDEVQGADDEADADESVEE